MGIIRKKEFRLTALLLMLCFHFLHAQDKTQIIFGKLTAADFNQPAPSFDSNANAVIIADIGKVSFEDESAFNLTMVYTRFIRVKIINKNGFDIGNYQILLSQGTGMHHEKLSMLRGSTFNLENGVISETRLDENSVYTEKLNQKLEGRKFSMPGLKEGSIYDLEYTTRSTFLEVELRSWEFQGKYPRLWSEFEVTIAPPYHYEMNIQGDDHFDIETAKEIKGSFLVYDKTTQKSTGITANSVYRRWVKKNVASLHEQPYTTTLKNYNTRLSFQLDYFEWPSSSSGRINFLTTWDAAAKTLNNLEGFGLSINHDNNWFYDDMKSITSGDKTDEEKTVHIYNYFRDNYKATSNYGVFANDNLRDVFKRKAGNVAEINLLLTSMLRKAGIQADPAILSTRENGIANPTYPLLSEYNYLICVVYLNNREITLDASQPYNGFGQLPGACYNGWGHIIDEEGSRPIYLSADSLRETAVTNVLIFNDDKGKPYGTSKIIFGRNESYNIRREILNGSKDSYEKKFCELKGSDLTIKNFEIDSLNKYELPVGISFDFELKNISNASILYFNPIVDEVYKTNPFKSINRQYPVEMPYQIDKMYVLNMDIPAGFQLDEIPKSARINYNGTEGFFEYIIQKGDNNIQLIVHLKLNKSFFPVEEYSMLREFFADVVKKESEQIVFRKIH